MEDISTGRARQVRWAGAAGLLAAGAIAGGVLAATFSASAATNTPTPSSSGSSAAVAPPADLPAHGSAAHEDQEKAVTGADATKARAAAVKAAGGGTAGEVTTDFTGDGYEVTVNRSDGSSTEVHLDQSFDVVGHGGFAR